MRGSGCPRSNAERRAVKQTALELVQERAYIRPAMPVTATDIRQIELQLYKAEHGFGMPYDAERVAQLRSMLLEARKQKLSRALAAKPPPPRFFRQLAVNYRQLAKIASTPEIKQRMLDMAAEYQAKAEEHSDEANRRATG